MSDALSLLRNFVKNKKEFHEEEDKIVFGDVYYPKNVKTTYLIYGSGKDSRPKDYYTLECLAFLIKHRELQHPMYVKTAGTRNISVVSRPDRRDLLMYLDGEVETTSSIDKNAPLEITMQRPQPYVKQAQQQQQQQSAVASMVAPSSVASTSALVAGLIPSGSLKRPVTQTSATTHLQDSSEAMLLGQDDLESSSKVARIDSSSSDQQQSSDQASSIIGRITRKFDESAAQSQRAITDNIMPLSESLTKEKIAALKAKKKAMQRNQVSAGMDLMDDDPVAQAAAGIAASSQAIAASSRGAIAGADRLSTSKLGEYSGYGLAPTTAEGDAVMKEIGKREVMVRNRFSVLQSSGKQFEKDILIYLTTVRAKEEGGSAAIIDPSTQNLLNNSTQATQIGIQAAGGGLTQQQRQMGYNRFDQERYAAKDETGGFSIDTKLTYQPNGGALSLTPNPAATPQHDSTSKSVNSSAAVVATATQKAGLGVGGPIRNATEPNVVAKLVPSPTSQPVKRTHAKPIIIVPNTNTSLITLYNCLDILQDLKYVTSEEKRKMLQNQNSAPKDCEIIMHRREDGRSQQFKVIDNVNKLQDQDWSRVVAVFAQGKQWQFKDWPFGYGNPAEIFTKVKGFHLKMSGIPIDPNVAKWSVTVIELDPHKRHLDRARLLAFWDELDKFMAKSKPYLCL